MKKNSKIGPQANLFASTTKPRQSPSVAGTLAQASNCENPSETVKSTVTLFNHQIVSLDRLCATIREKSKTAIDRSALIRAILTAIVDNQIDLSSAQSEAEISSIIADRLLTKTPPACPLRQKKKQRKN